MKELIFATNNRNKIKEIETFLNGSYQLKTLQEIGCNEELPETHETIEENSAEKAEYVYQHYKVNCFAEDTGLEVEALNGAPGVHSAHYAGVERDNDKNMDKVLHELEGISNRNAQFKTVITLNLNGQQHQFTGILKGSIGLEKKGSHGFGYDPIFVLDNGKTLAELTLEEKSSISHRAKATQQLVDCLKNV